MLKNIFNILKNLENITYKIMKKGLKFCFILCIISCIFLLTYNFVFTSPDVYYIGLALLKLSIYFTVDFIVCGIVVDNIKKQII
ncbi:MAG: hypothetical protein IKF38_02490 [Clostridia bacterium]|nr:hypothetical protein [Clostridia bacterium]